MRTALEAAAVLVSGALLGSFLGKFLAMLFPKGGRMHELLATEVTAGLSPTHLDLRVLDLTLGVVFRFNLLSVVGILIAAYLYRSVFGAGAARR